jgi:nucleoside-diphosphate kinase
MIVLNTKKSQSKKTKQALLVIIKPDGMSRFLAGEVLQRCFGAKMEVLAANVVKVSRPLVAEHYKHIKGKPFYEDTINMMMGKYHKQSHVLALVLRGENAIARCRDIIGATNPKEADPQSVRGRFGRVTPEGVFENVVHASSDPKEAEREIKLWFTPEQLSVKLFPTKSVVVNRQGKTVWA